MTSRTVYRTLVFCFLLAWSTAWGVEETPARAPRVPWIDDLDWADIVTLAGEQDHPIIIDFTATWCGPCKLLDVMVFTEKDVIAELADVVTYKVDIDKPLHAETKAMFDVTRVPTVIWCDQKGREIDRFTGYKSSREFLEVVRGWQENRTIDRMLAERRAESPEDPEVLLDLARRHADRDQMREAEVLYRRLMNMREGTEERTVARGMLGLAEMAAADGREDEARDLARRASHVFLPPDGDEGDHVPDLEGMLEVAAFQETISDTVGVMDTYRRMVEVDDRAVLALDGFARAAVAMRTDLEEGTRCAIRATVFSDKDPATIVTLAECYYYRGYYRKAIKWIDQAMEQVPDDPLYQEHLARYQEALADDPHGMKGPPR